MTPERRIADLLAGASKRLGFRPRTDDDLTHAELDRLQSLLVEQRRQRGTSARGAGHASGVAAARADLERIKSAPAGRDAPLVKKPDDPDSVQMVADPDVWAAVREVEERTGLRRDGTPAERYERVLEHRRRARRLAFELGAIKVAEFDRLNVRYGPLDDALKANDERFDASLAARASLARQAAAVLQASTRAI